MRREAGNVLDLHAAADAVVSQHRGPQFKVLLFCVDLHLFLRLRGFSPGTPASSHSPELHVRLNLNEPQRDGECAHCSSETFSPDFWECFVES